MAKAIGPTFADELAAAGLSGLPFAWGADGALHFDERMTPNEIADVEAVYAAHDPMKVATASADPLADLAATLVAKGVITMLDLSPVLVKALTPDLLKLSEVRA